MLTFFAGGLYADLGPVGDEDAGECPGLPRMVIHVRRPRSHRDAVHAKRENGLPVILVVGMRLGCISHSLLTVEAIQARGLRLAGWIANQIDPGMRHSGANLAALESRIPAPLIGRIPHLVPADPRMAVEHLNIELLK